jgi:hypothetical protein
MVRWTSEQHHPAVDGIDAQKDCGLRWKQSIFEWRIRNMIGNGLSSVGEED